MKMTSLAVSFLLVLVSSLVVVENAEAQSRCRGSQCRGGSTTPPRRGPNYNPNRGRDNRGGNVGRRDTTPPRRGPNYNPNRGRNNGGTTTRPPRRGDNYNPPRNGGGTTYNPRPNRPNRPGNGGTYNPRPNRPNRPGNGGYRPRPNPPRRYDPPRTRDWRRDRHYRAHTRLRHRPGSRTYVRYRHTPWSTHRVHTRRYRSARYYHYNVPYRYIYWNNWVRWRSTRSNGYYWVDGYPYFVYNGYRHRYSNYDTCDYELVDGYTNQVVRTFHSLTCARGYDRCANMRDDLNWRDGQHRYFCSERFAWDNNYNYNHNYNDDFYSDVFYGDDYYGDDYYNDGYYNDDYYYN